MFISTEKLNDEKIVKIIQEYKGGSEYQRLISYKKYYETENVDITSRWIDKENRRKKPNNCIPSAYYATVVDTMSGYMFQNIQYESVDEASKTYSESLNDIFKENNYDVKDMLLGIQALCFNKAAEIVYTIGNEKNTDVKISVLDPYSVIGVYTDDIEPTLYAAIWFRKHYNDDYDYMVDVIYNDEWKFYDMKDNKISLREEPKRLYFKENPVVIYKTDAISDKSIYHKIIPYIDALDVVITGNSNEIEKLVDALLVMSKVLKPEDKEHFQEWATLEDMKADDRAEYLTKDMSPVFRQYVSELLIQEIHKHSHTVDWYSPDSGIGGQVSAKALRTRLFDMDMSSNRIEKIYKDGIEKRIRLINQILNIKGKETNEINIIFNRTVPNDFEDKVVALNGVEFLSQQTKVEKCGIDWDEEKARLEEQEGQGEIFNEDETEANSQVDQENDEESKSDRRTV